MAWRPRYLHPRWSSRRTTSWWNVTHLLYFYWISENVFLLLWVQVQTICELEISPNPHCSFQSSAAVLIGVILCPRFQPFTAETVTFWIIKHKSNRKTTFRITNSPFNRHCRVTGWPDGFIGTVCCCSIASYKKSCTLLDPITFSLATRHFIYRQ